MNNKQWTVGVTHLIKPPFDPELAGFDGRADFLYFNSTDESSFDKEWLKSIDAFLVWTPAISDRTICHLDKCKIVVRYGVGVDNVDLKGLNNSGIAFSNNPEYGPEDVADTAVAMLLSLQRRIVEHDYKARQYADTWQENHLSPTRHSRHSTVGVIGVGRIGISVINRIRAFGYRIVGYDPYVSNGMFRALAIERADSMAELVKQSELVTLHCPLTDETRAMINDDVVNRAKPGMILVNTARGGLIESLDVIHAGLRSGQLAGAGLDVIPDEPPVAHPLIEAWRAGVDWLQGRLIITPHNAFFSDHSMYDCRYKAAETARLFLENGIHRNAVTS
jgi:D-3-phosphoglycerate dehydrogenase|tara:strand:- start:465 stop:1466 length:1002 start_codon:yes stop_codon:yes gene_type:complete